MPRDGMHPTDTHVGQRVRMRRLMLGMSQSHVGDALGITFQQLQKYEKGTNRISASRLQQIAHVFQVPVTFFFEGAPNVPGEERAQTDAPFPQFVSDYLATSDGLNLTKAFMQIPNAKLRRSIVNLLEQIAGPEDQ
jgi:transcriptional regulator with XRE-family HTH domain